MEFLFIVPLLLLSFGFTIVWIIAIIDIAKSEFKNANDKIVWLLMVILLPLFGVILYFILGRDQKIRPGDQQSHRQQDRYSRPGRDSREIVSQQQ
jgi:hypothetical protein